jgi:hypothetical protein
VTRLDAIEARLIKYQAAVQVSYVDRNHQELMAVGVFEGHAADDVQWLLTKVRELQRKLDKHTEKAS